METLGTAEIVATLREGLLVLTEELCVEYASQRFLDMFGVAESDTIGRPLSELGNGQWNIPELIAPLSRIIEDHSSIEDLEVDYTFEAIGRRVMRLNARKTVRPGNGSKRILLAIEDVTEAVTARREADHQRRLAQGIVDTIREPLLVLDADLKVIAASEAFYKTFEGDSGASVGCHICELGDGRWAKPELAHLLTNVIPSHSTIVDYEISQDIPEKGMRTFLLNAREILQGEDGAKTLLLAMQDITEQRLLDAERAHALEKANKLLEELNHRVMNSLTMIHSVIGLESRAVDNSDAEPILNRLRSRIKSVASLYSTLSSTGSVNRVKADAYLGTIVQDVTQSAESGALDLDVETCIDPVELPTETAVPLGLILNETITNSLKYAFADRGHGKLAVTFKCAGNGYQLVVWDDGVGIDADARVDSGIGQRLITSFTQQLEGEMTVVSDSSGTRIVLDLPMEAIHGSARPSQAAE